ncbi:MAG: XRE family transcriptional regulator [Flavobacterium sp.]|nr:MAG: XRE family transcriptional regulator [Flavobacterium sp.]
MPKPNPKNQKAIEKLGLKVRKLRIEKGFTLIELAGLCDVDYTTISKIERGLINTTVSMINIIAEALKIHPSVLLED